MGLVGRVGEMLLRREEWKILSRVLLPGVYGQLRIFRQSLAITQLGKSAP
jgi:hypothetical protein